MVVGLISESMTSKSDSNTVDWVFAHSRLGGIGNLEGLFSDLDVYGV